MHGGAAGMGGTGALRRHGTKLPRQLLGSWWQATHAQAAQSGWGGAELTRHDWQELASVVVSAERARVMKVPTALHGQGEGGAGGRAV